MINRRKIRSSVRALLEKYRIVSPPVPVEAIARAEGILVRYQPFEGRERSLSGVLFRLGGTIIIGVNSLEVPARRRFTVAHELGHYFLGHLDQVVHVDEKIPLTLAPVYKFRDERSQNGTVVEEVEANAFAAELLMPEEFIARELRRFEDVSDVDEVIDTLAERFEVSVPAMTVRLTALGYVRP